MVQDFVRSIVEFKDFGKATIEKPLSTSFPDVQMYINEFWTSKQRAAHSLHEISYRACFKPQLPRFFIQRLSREGDVVYDPFMGRGTTLLEAALLGRIPMGCDINPLSDILLRPRLNLPPIKDVEERLRSLDLDEKTPIREDLLVFYHPKTLSALTNLRNYLLERDAHGGLDAVDQWIRMVATNRLTGHSKGFFSVYTLPPNQAVSIQSQRRINEKRGQSPPFRDVRQIILSKSKSLMKDVGSHTRDQLAKTAAEAQLIVGSSDNTPTIASDSVKLVVTSPPFLNVVDYQLDNWLRCWFNGMDPGAIGVWKFANPLKWSQKMTATFQELRRVLQPGGCVAFEVGEIRKSTLLLEQLVIPAAIQAGLTPVMVIINDQTFTKTSNCWGVDNLRKGTNTNRIVLLRKD
ncbi:MAG: DNA methyltransferase [Desulfomonilaceae bacterium]